MKKEEWEIINQSNDEYIRLKALKMKWSKELILAVEKEDLARIQKVKKHISLSEIYEGVTALSIAVMKNNHELIDYLIEHGADINTLFYHGKDVAWLALENGNNVLFKKFLPNSSLNLVYEGKTRLMQAVEMSNVQAVQTLLNYGIDIHIKDEDGRTALHYNFFKNPYTEQDKLIGAMLLATGLEPKEEDLSDIPAYGYLQDIEDIKDYYNINTLPDLPYYKLKRIEKIREKDIEPDGILAKYKDVNQVTKTTIKRPKSFKSYYLPKMTPKK